MCVPSLARMTLVQCPNHPSRPDPPWRADTLLGFVTGRWADGPNSGEREVLGGKEREYEREKSTGEGEQCEREGVSEGSRKKKKRIEPVTCESHISYESRRYKIGAIAGVVG